MNEETFKDFTLCDSPKINIELVKGQYITFDAYYGYSKIAAEILCSYLQDNLKNSIPIPLNGCNFNILVKSFELAEFPDITHFHSIYKIELKGELV